MPERQWKLEGGPARARSWHHSPSMSRILLVERRIVLDNIRNTGEVIDWSSSCPSDRSGSSSCAFEAVACAVLGATHGERSDYIRLSSRTLWTLLVAEPLREHGFRAWSIPALRWLRDYRRDGCGRISSPASRSAAYLLPAGIGNASLAGLPPEAGLYACLFSGLVFWLFCSSKHTVITATSALSLLIGASVGELSGGDPARHAALAAVRGAARGPHRDCRVAGSRRQCRRLLLRDRARRLQSGAGALPGEHAAPKLFGFKGTHGDFWERSAYFITHLGETHQMSLLVGAAAFSILIAGKLWLKNRPVAFWSCSPACLRRDS